MINESINKLLQYGLNTGLIEKEDKVYVANRLISLLGLPEFVEQEVTNTDLEEILASINDYAVEQGIIEDTVTNRDLFDTKIMGELVKRPSEVIREFNHLYKESPKKATDFFYKLSQDSDYIRRYRIKKDMKWKVDTKYGKLDITINLSKPEKDSRAIAAARNVAQTNYPKCMLCIENEGYEGRINHPARQNLRIIPIELNGEKWGMQYSPYVYYNEHCIALKAEHTPMKIDITTLKKLLDFIDIFPHYFMGSNAGLPIVGGSILTHEHFQGGNYTFPMTVAEDDEKFEISGYEDVIVTRLKWPMSVIRLSSTNRDRILKLADHILNVWENYSDESVFIFAETNGEKHNAVTPIARKNGDNYEVDLVLRNNITTEEFPDGVFHPHPELHHIKKENIGLIEVMGLAVLPPRLKTEMQLVKEYILENKDLSKNEQIEKHTKWVEEIKQKYSDINRDNIDKIIEEEIGIVFMKVLEDAGVFKRDEKGIEAFRKFINTL
ncbi:MAG: UDP-glucose--hexose-1-phosphate uridylyltransferase [Clostridiales bacterium]|nr:UDP-glucose--hexose-1-phosphate uridylyltransferase [Clostridiales bacterium]